jgi:hypothetical protein
VTAVVMSLNGSTQYPRACQALSAMLSRNALNPADITVLFKMYSSPDPPPVELIRAPQFLGTIKFYRYHISTLRLLTASVFIPAALVNFGLSVPMSLK